MELTRHGMIRQQQRGIPQLIVDLLVDFGHGERAGAETTRYFFDKKSKKRLEKYAGALASVLAEHMDCVAIVSDAGQLITVAHRLKRARN